MNTTFLIGVLLGVVGALLMNIGKGVQKQYVHVLLQGRAMFSAEHRRTLGMWGVGLGMTASASVPYSLGIWLSESPSTISAMTGIGLIGLAIYASRVIGERLGTADRVGITLVVSGTLALGAIGAGGAVELRDFELPTLLAVIGVMLGLAVTGCLVALAVRRIHGVAYGMAAGLAIGLAMFLVDVGKVSAGSIVGSLGTAYPWLALLSIITALVVTQLGFFRGRALEVVPAVNSATIFTPLVLEWFVYGQPVQLVTLIPILVIGVGVFLLSTGAAARVSS